MAVVGGEVEAGAVLDAGLGWQWFAGAGVGAVRVEDLGLGEGDEAAVVEAPSAKAVGVAGRAGAQDEAAGGGAGDAGGEDGEELRALGGVEGCGAGGCRVRVVRVGRLRVVGVRGVGAQGCQQVLVGGGDAADELVPAGSGEVEDAQDRVGGLVEGGAADVLAAVGARPASSRRSVAYARVVWRTAASTRSASSRPMGWPV
ncbi:hypothetical protein J5J01_19095 [Streptomyces fradiae]|nr:hypothetical protein J5J01_19095 [Streptomyces fradiae]